ncbi:MAG: T9SS type A sorting domain-containing protein, partial [Bacteroidetes bacterium]|nr:T9SS type A sorting domain-containing protein [Bacteroidota bacterium]
AAYGGIYKSIDGGRSWTASKADGRAMYTDVAVTPQGILYASLSTASLEGNDKEEGTPGLYRSGNGGLSWQAITPPGWPLKFGRVIISYNKQSPNEVYFLGHTNDAPILWRYNHAGSGGSWTNLSANLPEEEGEVGGLDLQGGYNMVLEVHPDKPQTVFVGGTNLFRSTNGFTSIDATSWIGGYSPENDVNPYPDQHPDQHRLLFYPSNPARAIAAHDGGLSTTVNILADDEDETEKVDWTFLNRGYVTTQFYTIGLDQSQVNDLIIGGMQDNGSYLTPAANNINNNWTRVLGGDGGYTHVANRGAYYYVSFQNSQIYRLTLNDNYGLSSFARVDPPDAGLVNGQAYLFVNPYVFDPTSQNRMYLAAGDVVYRNRNVSQIPSGSQQPAGLNWQRLIETQVDSGSISAISISSVPADILYYGTSTGEVYKATNANSEPVVSHISSPDFPEDGYVAHISINPANADELVVVFSNYKVRSIFYSDNGGETFVHASGNLEEFPNGEGSGPSVRHVEIIPLTTGDVLYLAGTSTGLYSTRQFNGESTVWQQEAPELIGRVVVPQIRHRSLDGRVVVATHGNGVYYKNFDDVLNTYLDPSGIPISMDAPYPNPATPDDEVVIPFNLPRNGTTRIRIYSATGKLIRLLYYNQAFAGQSEVVWNGRNVAGIPVPPGIYMIRLEFEDQILSRKVILQH